MTWNSVTTIKLGQESGVSKRDLPIKVPPVLHEVLSHLASQGHKGLIVGGAVRDAMMGQDPKDLDVECYGPTYEELSDTLRQHGRVNLVGKAFGVAKLKDKEGHEYDFSLPRRDSKSGVGHKDFTVEVDPNIHPKEAAARRDYTINSMAWDPLTKELHDHFGGEQDLKDKVLRHTSEAFSEDPLRVLRGMQFAARYGMSVHPETAHLSQSISHEYSTIPKERVSEEFMKLATKGKEPGRAIQYLKDTGWHENFPELHAMYGVKQEPKWHPEGDLETHTAHAMDAAAKIADREGLKDDDRAVVVFGAMAHDMGKPSNTSTNESGEIISHGHDTAGGPVARSFLQNIGIKPAITDKVVPLVENHMQHLNYENGISSRTVRRLAERLHPASIKELSYVMESDHSGRPPLPGGIPSGTQKMLDKAEESHVTEHKQEKIVNGRDVLPYFPGEPGPHIGEVVKDAFEAQLNGEINTPEEGKAWLERRFSKTASDLRPDGWCQCGHPSDSHPEKEDFSCKNCDCDFYYDYWPAYPKTGWKSIAMPRDDDFLSSLTYVHDKDSFGEVGSMHDLHAFDGDKRVGTISWTEPAEGHCGRCGHEDDDHGSEDDVWDDDCHGEDGCDCKDDGGWTDASFVNGLDVNPEHRRKGVASELFRRAQEITPHIEHDPDPDRISDEAHDWIKSLEKDGSWKSVAMPRDDSFINNLSFEHITKSKQHTIHAWAPGADHPFGTINWIEENEDDPPTVTSLNVYHSYQRHGLGSELLRRAKEIEPNLHHDSTLTDDGWKLVHSLGDQAAGPVTSSWKDVRQKAVRLRNANLVDIILINDEVIAADVQGDHATYHVVLYRQFPDSLAITIWECSCRWGDWAFKRQVTYVGRMCSHALATLYEADSREQRKMVGSWKKMGALKPHDHHDIEGEAELKRHMLRKHVAPDDDDLRQAIHGLPHEERQLFHQQDHDFFGEHGWGDSQDYGSDWDYDQPSSKAKTWEKPKKKRAEEYVKDVEPGEKREGDDFDYDTRWLNKDLNHHVLDTVKSLSDSYPVTKKWFKGIRVSDAGPMPCVVPGDKRIWLPPSYMDKPGSPARAPQKSLDHLIAHEFGHVLHASIQANECGADTVPDASMDELLHSLKDQDIRDAHNVAMHHPDSPATWAMDSAKKKFPGQSASSYAEKDDLERFAESMADHWTSHDPAEQSKHVGGMIDFLYHKDSPAWKERKESKLAAVDLQDMLADHETREAMKKEAWVDRDEWTHNGKPFSFGAVDPLDGHIEEVHPYAKAEAADFHHSMYFSQETQTLPIFWMEKGQPTAMWTLPPHIRGRIKEQIQPAPKTADIHTALRKEKLTFYAATGRPVRITVEVADDSASIQQGLMNRPMLPMMDGMVFVPPYKPSYTGFWMKNTLIPLSIAFWGRDGIITEIIDMKANDMTVHKPKLPWWGAVEVNKGFFRQWSILVGCRVILG